ncbi:Hpt domain-containing protein [Arthrobacter sp. G.S.26]|uniref:Hpt domain-containing protein n=1 Tax=Micrococcaceae TaxID=1268 RepID=UPI0025548425|nr:Hpt domain-containing protein [Pseudarthrobacter sp. MEB009]
MNRESSGTESPDRKADVVLDRSLFFDLVEQLSSEAGATEFATSFLAMLPGRVRAIEEPLAATSIQAARTAALSLSSSAAMIGAEQLGRDATLINQHLKNGSLQAARDAAERLAADAKSLTTEIEHLLAGD